MKRTEYNQWVSSLRTSKDPNYWDNMLSFSPYIVEDMAYLKQHEVAKKLNISPVILSNVKPLLLAYHRRNINRETDN